MRWGGTGGGLPLPVRQVAIAISLAVIAIVVASFARLAIQEYQLNVQKQALEKSVTSLKAENQSLQHQIAYLHTDAAIEHLAREELGWVKPGDTAVIIITSKTPPPLGTPSKVVATPSRETPLRQWWQLLFGEATARP